MAAEVLIPGDFELVEVKTQYGNVNDNLATDIKILDGKSEIFDHRNNDQMLFSSTLLTQVAHFFNNKLYSDVVILLEDCQQLYAHRVFLSFRSENWGQGVTNLHEVNTIDFTDIKYDVAYSVIKWVYTDELETVCDENFIMEVFQVASLFQIPALCERCSQALIMNTNVTNCNRYYKLASDLSCQPLLDYCTEFMAKEKVPMKFEDPHLPEESLSEQTYTCQIENGVYKFVETRFYCSICDQSFETKHRLARHTVYHRGIRSRPYKCGECTRRFSNQSDLDNHLQKHKKDKAFGIKYVPFQGSKKRGRLLQCDICEETFNQKNELLRHRVSHTGQKPYKCDVCGDTFLINQSLIAHKRNHTGEKPYSCTICSRAYNYKSCLRVHMRTHTNEKPHQCSVCGKSFAEKAHLSQHSLIHTGEMPYSCTYCNKPFRHKVAMVVHLRIHTGEKPHQCDVCGKSFRESGRLKDHYRSHTKERPFVCSVCQQTYSYSSHLRRHQKQAHAAT